MRALLEGALMAAGIVLAGAVEAEVKIGMITTLSGGGSHLGIDVRDGFALALKQSGRTDVKLIVKDDARKPDLAKQIADEMIQRDGLERPAGGSRRRDFRPLSRGLRRRQRRQDRPRVVQ